MSLSSDGAVMPLPVTPAYQGGNGGFGGNNEPAEQHGERNEEPIGLSVGQRRAELCAERGKADVDAGEKQHQPGIGVKKPDQNLAKTAPRQLQEEKLEQEENDDNRQHGNCSLL